MRRGGAAQVTLAQCARPPRERVDGGRAVRESCGARWYRNLAMDLIEPSKAFMDRWESLANRTAVTQAQVERASNLGLSFIQDSGLRDRKPLALPQATAIRQRVCLLHPLPAGGACLPCAALARGRLAALRVVALHGPQQWRTTQARAGTGRGHRGARAGRGSVRANAEQLAGAKFKNHPRAGLRRRCRWPSQASRQRATARPGPRVCPASGDARPRLPRGARPSAGRGTRG